MTGQEQIYRSRVLRVYLSLTTRQVRDVSRVQAMLRAITGHPVSRARALREILDAGLDQILGRRETTTTTTTDTSDDRSDRIPGFGVTEEETDG